MSHNEAGLNTAGLLKELSGVLFTQQKQRACLTLQKQQLMSIGSMDKAKKKTPTQHETIAMKSVVVDRKRSEEMQARRKSSVRQYVWKQERTNLTSCEEMDGKSDGKSDGIRKASAVPMASPPKDRRKSSIMKLRHRSMKESIVSDVALSSARMSVRDRLFEKHGRACENRICRSFLANSILSEIIVSATDIAYDAIQRRRRATKRKKIELIPLSIKKFFAAFLKKESTTEREIDIYEDEISKSQFIKAVRIYLKIAKYECGDKLFKIFDLDGSGAVSLVEFYECVRIIKDGADKDKLKLVFTMYAAGKPLTIQFEQILSAIKTKNGDVWGEATFSQQLMNAMDDNGNGIIDFEEFVEVCCRVPIYFHFFLQGLPIALARESFDPKHGLGFSMMHMCRLWCHGLSHTSGSNASGEVLDVKGFRSVAALLFNMSRGSAIAYELSRRLFQIFDADDSGLIEFGEFMAGMSSFFYGTIGNRARSVFALLDIDNQSAVGIQKTQGILESRHASTDATDSISEQMQQVSSILAKLNAACDGYLTQKDFVTVVTSNPHMLEWIEQLLFHTNSDADTRKLCATL